MFVMLFLSLKYKFKQEIVNEKGVHKKKNLGYENKNKQCKTAFFF